MSANACTYYNSQWLTFAPSIYVTMAVNGSNLTISCYSLSETTFPMCCHLLGRKLHFCKDHTKISRRMPLSPNTRVLNWIWNQRQCLAAVLQIDVFAYPIKVYHVLFLLGVEIQTPSYIYNILTGILDTLWHVV